MPLGTKLFLAAAAASFAAISAPASSQPAPAQLPTRTFNLTKEERAALLPVQNAITAKDWAAARAALPAAVAAARGPDARYAVGRFQLEIGLGTSDVALQAQGLDNLIASGQIPAADLPIIYGN